MRLIVGGRERSRGRVWFIQQKLLSFFSIFWKGLCHVFVFTTNFCLPKSIFHTHVYRETTPVHCCEMSRHINRAWQGSSPPLGTRAAELSMVFATVVEAVDRSRHRQTYVPSKIQEGRPLSPQCTATPRCCLRRSCLTASSWSQLKLSQSTDWNHLSLVHTHTFALPCTGHTHRCRHIHRIKKQQIICHRIIAEVIC